jgi:hypothetical protein
MHERRQLNIEDLAKAWRLSAETAEKISDPLIAELRSLEMPSGRDPAGIPYRAEVFREIFEGRTIEELRAAYVILRRLQAQSGLFDALEFAAGEDR